jgi:hypothetical protein
MQPPRMQNAERTMQGKKNKNAECRANNAGKKEQVEKNLVITKKNIHNNSKMWHPTKHTSKESEKTYSSGDVRKAFKKTVAYSGDVKRHKFDCELAGSSNLCKATFSS